MLVFQTNIFAQEVNIAQYSVGQGLPQSQVNKIFIDSRGMLWTATSGGGIASFDGLNFTVYDESSGLAGNIVLDIEEDEKGRIFTISTWGGISILENNKISKVIPYPEGLTGVSAIEKDSYGTLWIAGNNLCYIQNDELVEVDSDLTLPFIQNPNLKCFGEKLLVSFNDKILTFDVKAKKQIKSKSYPFDILVAFIDNKNNVLIGTDKNGLFKEFDNQISPVDLPSNNSNSSISITDIFQQNNNKLWFASKKGAYCIENDEVVFFANDKGVGEYDITSICFDEQENIWLGTKGEGIIGIVNTPFTYYSNYEGFNKPDNFAIINDNANRLWTGNNEKGIFILENENVINLTIENGLPDNGVRAFAISKDNFIWTGTRKGLCKISSDYKITTIPEFNDMYVKSLLISKSGEIYVGTIGDGLWEINEENKTITKLYESEIKNVHSMCFDLKENLVVGTNYGCHYIENGAISFYKENLKNTFIGNITCDKNGKIWVGTDRSISRLDDGIFTNFDVSNGLISDVIYILFSDSEGNLWSGTNKGLDKITLDNNSNIVKIKHFGYSEGFKGIETNSKAYYECGSKEIYFATVSGIHKYNPKHGYNFSYNTPVYINKIKLFLEDIDESNLNGSSKSWFGIPQNLTLEPDQNHITFEFFAVDYLNPKGVEYTYFLEGFDKNWSPPTKLRTAVYSNLPPGNYVFKVKQFGNNFSQIATINLKVKMLPPPFYKSVWFLLLIMLAMVIVVYYFTEYRTYKLKNQQAYLESKIEERTLEIQESEKEKTVLLQEVHHRVKNNLQIIISLFRLQSHFTDNEEALELFRNSQNRIRSMSKIHEKLYETKDLANISIEEYIAELIHDIIESYDIKNTVKVNAKIEKCIIPLDDLTPLALIINEIITNSLKYGLKDVENPEIFISIAQTVIGDTTLVCGDNGNGFDEKIWIDHQTMGMELIKTLADQLDGDINLTQETHKTFYTLKFKTRN
jgi:two-component sensor histidine kinase/ligand-binding sensor domain-containing protein